MQRHYTTRPVCTNEGLKHVIPDKDVSFEGLNDVPLNFGSHSPKNSYFWPGNRSFKHKQQKLLCTKADRDETFTGDSHHEWAFMGGRTAPQQI